MRVEHFVLFVVGFCTKIQFILFYKSAGNCFTVQQLCEI